jgi:cysteine desulfurase
VSPRLYLDHAAAWPLRPEAAAAWSDAATVAVGDPARAHAEGRASAELLGRATEATAAAVGAAPDALTWTSGGTEAVHLAVHGLARADALAGGTRRHLVVSAVEHSAVLAAVRRLCTDHGFRVDVVDVDGAGLVDPDAVAASLTDETLAVHLQHANHEVGAIQPVTEVARACARVGALLHVDACQSVGQLGLSVEDLGADLLTASAAKFGGPRNVGFLAQGPRGRVVAVQEGDDRQARRRAGQLDVPSVAAGAVALQVALRDLQTERSARELVRRHLRTRLPEVVDDVEVHGPLADAHPGIVAASALYVDGEALVRELDTAGFAVHSGSSCASTSGEPSHVLVAMGALTHGHVRVSVGPSTTVADADRFLEAYAAAVVDLRARVGR